MTDKIAKLTGNLNLEVEQRNQALDDTISALQTLGYKETLATQVVNKILQKLPKDINSQDLIKHALLEISS